MIINPHLEEEGKGMKNEEHQHNHFSWVNFQQYASSQAKKINFLQVGKKWKKNLQPKYLKQKCKQKTKCNDF